MICLAVTYTVRPGHEDEAAEHLRALTGPSRAEPGCRMWLAHRSVDDPRVFLIYEQYDDEAAFEAHRATPHFAKHGRGGIQRIAESRVAVVAGPLE